MFESSLDEVCTVAVPCAADSVAGSLCLQTGLLVGCNCREDFNPLVHPWYHFYMVAASYPWTASLLCSPFCVVLVKVFFLLLAQSTFTCGDFHIEFLFTHHVNICVFES